MKIFKELKKLGYIHYSATTIEELDDLPLNSAERVSEQALVLRWFREKYKYYNQIHKGYGWEGIIRDSNNGDILWNDGTYNSPEEAELECLKKLIEIVKNK
jgi:hypothetical protein